MTASVEVVRGGVVESTHTVHAVASHADSGVLHFVGDRTALTYYRSAAKPMQALPLVEEGIADRMGLSEEEIALCCASHEGEAEHIAGARSILARAHVTEDLLRCGAHAPYSAKAARALIESGEPAARIHNNCSGKHAGMLALAVGMKWDPVDYHEADHPVQQRMLREIVRWSGVPAEKIPTGVDGCGVTCFAVPLDAMATSCAKFTAASDQGDAAARVVAAMTAHPFMVGGTGRTCTDVMTVAGDRCWVKLGAEGVYTGGLRNRGIGFAIKVADGGRRAVEVALIRILHGLGALTDTEADKLSIHGRPDVFNTRDEVVGEIRAGFDFELRSVEVR